MSNIENDPIIAIGLGNPGREYEYTRHNVGFMVVDEVSTRYKGVWKPGEGEYLVTRCTVNGRLLILVKPLTYMNNSGEAVVDVLEKYPTPHQNVLVIADDFALDIGTVRVRASGSDGGHNGLRSIIYFLNSDEVPRVRCGIKKEIMPPKREMSDFVLSPFDENEIKTAGKMIEKAADALEEFARSGIERTMNIFNKQGLC